MGLENIKIVSAKNIKTNFIALCFDINRRHLENR